MSLTSTHAIVLWSLALSSLSLLQCSPLQDLNHTLILIVCPKLIIKSLLASSIVGILSTVLVCDEDFEAADDLRKGDRAVVLPVLDGLHVVDHDYEVFVLALVVDFGLGGVSAGHCCGFFG